MRRALGRLLFSAFLTILPGSLAWAGGIRGTMYNLPQNGTTPIAGEDIDIKLFDTVDNGAVIPLDSTGAPFPASRIKGDGAVTVAGPSYAFTVPNRTDGRPRVLNVQFFRANPPKGIVITQLMQELRQVVIDPAHMLVLDVVVPAPQPQVMNPGCYCYPCPHYCYPVSSSRCFRGPLLFPRRRW